ncbi:hypothetical protein F511_15601 [Dorcoceras hygrometricum]|uniref:CCHC-type domain-containing protein n=1 Tax=Dorcoceras hygrometricum TaxID=472368 RepID=A0A2Z7B2F7_9LAMI|nr:hypothetical protein F511_15601 [Dorcoceras hygrometricum]
MMRALIRECDVKMVAVQELENLNMLELHDWFVNLKAYGFELENILEGEPSTSQPTKILAVVEKKAIKAVEQLSNDAMSLFLKKFEKFMKNNQSQCSNFSDKRVQKNDSNTADLSCFNCGSTCHFAAEYTKPKKDDNKSSDYRWRKNDKNSSMKQRD